MYKVITIVTGTTPEREDSSREVTYPELEKLFEEGYEIERVIEPKNQSQSGVATTFVLIK